MPAAWYWRQSQSENGDSRPICQSIVRSQKTRAACTGERLEQQHGEREAVATAKPPKKISRGRARRACG